MSGLDSGFLQDEDTRAFYLRPLEKTPAKLWFVNVPVGINTLNGVLSKICGMVTNGNVPKYTNHSLRATAASCWFQKGVPGMSGLALPDYMHTKGLLMIKIRLHACNALTVKDATFMSSTSSNATR